LIDRANSSGLVDVIEEPIIRKQPKPTFVANFSGSQYAPWFKEDQDIHGSYLVTRENVLLFGPNHLVSDDGSWSCESRAFKSQFIDAMQGAGYQAIFPGNRPKIESDQQNYILRTAELDTDQNDEIDAPIFLATPLEPDNWGRWIMTVTPKIAQFLSIKHNDRSFFCRAMYPWQRGFLRYFGISDSVFLEHDPGKTYLCDDVLTVEYNVPNMTISKLEREIFAEIVKRNQSTFPVKSKIFVSRMSHSKKYPNYRVLQNEAELANRLTGLNFAIIEPEFLTIADQIKIFSSADVIICLGGAGLFNAAFCRPKTKIVTIESSDVFIRAHTQLLSSLDLDYGIIFGKQDNTDPRPDHRRWTIDVDKVIIKLLEEIG